MRRGRSCAPSPSTETSSAPAGSAAVRTASPARSRSPPRWRRRAPSWRGAEKQTGELGAALSGALAEQSARQDAAEQALAALNESDAAISAIYEQLGRLGQDARTADDEWQRLIRQRDELEAGRVQTVEELAALEQRLHNAEQAPLFDVRSPPTVRRRSPRPRPPAPPRSRPG